MIKSCKECKDKCCKSGPGPYKKVSAQVFLGNFGEFENYNVECEAFVNNRCAYWGSDLLPHECKVFICSQRSFTENEISKIAKLTNRETGVGI